MSASLLKWSFLYILRLAFIAFLINDGMSQQNRLTKLNKINIQQMNILNEDSNRKLLK